MVSAGLRVAVLSDINMPGMDGAAIAREIKQRFPELPVMMVPLTVMTNDGCRRPCVWRSLNLKAQLRQLSSAPG